MSTDFSNGKSNVRGILLVGEVMQRLAKQVNGNWSHLSDCCRQVVNDPLRAKAVYLAMAGNFVPDIPMTKAEWVERESVFLNAMYDVGLPNYVRLEDIYQDGYGHHDRYVHKDLKTKSLLDALQKVGVNIDSIYDEGICEKPTAAGTISVDLSTLMQPTDDRYRPFMSDLTSQEFWAIEMGGHLPTVELCLYVVLRAKIEHGWIPYGEWECRCNNDHQSLAEKDYHSYVSSSTGIVKWSPEHGLSITHKRKDFSDPKLSTFYWKTSS